MGKADLGVAPLPECKNLGSMFGDPLSSRRVVTEVRYPRGEVHPFAAIGHNQQSWLPKTQRAIKDGHVDIMRCLGDGPDGHAFLPAEALGKLMKEQQATDVRFEASKSSERRSTRQFNPKTDAALTTTGDEAPCAPRPKRNALHRDHDKRINFTRDDKRRTLPRADGIDYSHLAAITEGYNSADLERAIADA